MPPCAPMPTPPATRPVPAAISAGEGGALARHRPRGPPPERPGPTPYCGRRLRGAHRGEAPGPRGGAAGVECVLPVQHMVFEAPSVAARHQGRLSFFVFRCVYRAGSRRTARPSTRGSSDRFSATAGERCGGQRTPRRDVGGDGGKHARRTRATADRPLSTRAATIARCHPEAARLSTPSTRDGDAGHATGRADVVGVASNDDVDRRPT